MAIILWEQIDWITGSLVYIEWDDLPSSETNNKLKKMCNEVSVHDFEPFSSTRPAEEYITSFLCGFSEADMTKLMQRSEHWMKLSPIYGLNYLPHPLRAKYISEQHLYERIGREILKRMEFHFSREQLLKVLDNDMLKYYNEIKKRLDGQPLSFDYSSLYKYIRKDCSTPQDELAFALKLRERSDVKALRRSLNALDVTANEVGSVQAVDKAIGQIDEEFKSMTSIFPKTPKLGEIACKISFAGLLAAIMTQNGLTLPEILMLMGLTYSVNIPLKWTRKNKVIDMVFLNKVITYGATGRWK